MYSRHLRSVRSLTVAAPIRAPGASPVTRRVRKLALAALILVATPSSYAADIGTAFSYQGQLKQDGAPANGNLDMEFRLFDASTLGNQVGNPVTLNGVAVSNGLFTVTLNAAGEFGAAGLHVIGYSRAVRFGTLGVCAQH